MDKQSIKVLKITGDGQAAKKIKLKIKRLNVILIQENQRMLKTLKLVSFL